MVRQYPWSLLDIDPTSDERAIRKAYATRLKITRPDEDPGGFQALVEAKDHALALRFEVANEHEPTPAASGADISIESPEPEAAARSTEKDQAVTIPTVSLASAQAADPQPNHAAADHSGGSDDLGWDASARMFDRFALMLEAIDRQGSEESLERRWSEIFDVIESASLEDGPQLKWMALGKLQTNLERDMGKMPDVSTWIFVKGPSAGRRGILGNYADVLTDLERRFHFLKEDTVLLEYLDHEDTRELAVALTIAAGRDIEGQPDEDYADEANTTPMVFVKAAFGEDEKMMAYVKKARQGEYSLSFSIWAILFPILFAIHKRLYGVALFCALTFGAWMVLLGGSGTAVRQNLALSAMLFYLFATFALALNWRRMRLDALDRRTKRLVAKGLTPLELGQRLRAWGKPNLGWTWGPLFVLYVWSKIGLVIQFFSSLLEP